MNTSRFRTALQFLRSLAARKPVRIAINVLKYVIPLGLMAYMIASTWKPDSPNGLKAIVWQEHVVEGKPINWSFLALAAACGATGISITFLRWFFLVRAVELPFRLKDAFRLGSIGLFFNTFLPGSVGGDFIKAAFLAREHSRRTVAVATVIMDRVIALWALIWFVALLGTTFWTTGQLEGTGSGACRTIVILAWTTVAVTLAAWLLLGFLSDERAEKFAGRLERLPGVGHAAGEFWRAVWMYRRRPKSVFGVLAMSWVGHVFFVLLFYGSVRTLCEPGPDLPTLAQHFLIVPIGLVIQAIPGFPGGAGIGELGFGELYKWLGFPIAAGVAGSLVQRLVNMGLSILGGLAYLRMRGTVKTDDVLDQEDTKLAHAEV